MLFLFFLAVGLGISSAAEPVDSRCRIDLGFVVDTTQSIKEENVEILKESLKLIIPQIGISANGTHVSLATFAKEATLHNKFSKEEFHNTKAVHDLIESSIGNLSKPTRIDRALKAANEEMFTDQSGMRPGISKKMILLTDGRTHPKSEDIMPHVQALKSKGVFLLAVAIGPDAKKEKNKDVLRAIAGENVIFVADFADLQAAQKNITVWICPPSPCARGLDLALLVDKTKSVTLDNFRMLKGFLRQISGSVGIGPDADGTHTGFILFSRTAEVLNTFAESQYYSTEAVEDLIDAIPDKLGSRTFIDKALTEANNTLFTEEGGDRPGHQNVLILFIDGKTNENSTAFTEIVPSLEEKQVHRIAVGIGKYKHFIGQLHDIAGEENTFTADNFDELTDLLDDILKNACPETKPPE